MYAQWHQLDQFYNVGTGTKTSLKELAELIIKLTNATLRLLTRKEALGHL